MNGVSDQSANGISVEELSKIGNIRIEQVGVSTVGQIIRRKGRAK